MCTESALGWRVARSSGLLVYNTAAGEVGRGSRFAIIELFSPKFDFFYTPMRHILTGRFFTKGGKRYIHKLSGETSQEGKGLRQK